MGCFSFLCKECGKAILSDSHSGDLCRLYWLKDGKVHQEMRGQYDSYGKVFTPDLDDEYMWSNQEKPVLASEMLKKQGKPDNAYSGSAHRGSNKWDDPWPEPVSGTFSGGTSTTHNVIAAVHEKCFKGNIPTTGSEDDPNQGWGEDLDLL